ncbi:MAG: nucleotide exchange factor GrpE [Corynebacterium sp.]|nr:nucleotide exchange factor GrpE [Corynebacterium sp.]
MTQPQDPLSQDPGNPEQTDPEATSPESAEAAADAAAEAQAAAAVEEALADVDLGDPESQDSESQDTQAQAAEANTEDMLAERTEDLQRLNAEYTNYRRRAAREREAAKDNARAQVLQQLLPILDDLDLAAQHGDLEEGPLKAFADKFTKTVTDLGVTPFAETGDEFDPERHEAVQDLSEGDEKVIATVLRRGYAAQDRLLRTAMVIIGDPA